MGVVFIGYKKAVPVSDEDMSYIRRAWGDENEDLYDFLDRKSIHRIWGHKVFAYSLVGLDIELTDHYPDGLDENSSFYYLTWGGADVSFSYGGYSVFRKALSKAVLGIRPEKVWDRREVFSSVPFFELINFSDCEGYISAEASRNLVVDFETYRDDFVEYANEGSFYTTQYDAMTEVFRTASGQGVVGLH